jgi:hypothetical protein
MIRSSSYLALSSRLASPKWWWTRSMMATVLSAVLLAFATGITGPDRVDVDDSAVCVWRQMASMP